MYQLISYQIQPGDNCWLVAQRYNTTIDALMAVNAGVHPYQLYVGQLINLPFIRQPIPVSGTHAVQAYPRRDSPCITKAAADLKSAFRTLWEQHVSWTRMTIISMAENLRDVDLVTNRLLRNPSDMAAVLRPYYGDQVSAKFTNLLRNHLVIAANLVKAAKSGDTKTAEKTEKQWFANADEIVAFLNSINPYWSTESLRNMFYTHLRLTKAEAVSRLTKDYAAEIATFDKIEEQALEMADAFADGIVKQFSDQFY